MNQNALYRAREWNLDRLSAAAYGATHGMPTINPLAVDEAMYAFLNQRPLRAV